MPTNPNVFCVIAGAPCTTSTVQDLANLPSGSFAPAGIGLAGQGEIRGIPGQGPLIDFDTLFLPSADILAAFAAPETSSVGPASATEISAQEMAQIDAIVEAELQAARPVIEVTQAQADAFLEAQRSIMERFGITESELTPAQDPILVVTDEPVAEDTSQDPLPPPFTVPSPSGPEEVAAVGPGGVVETTGPVEPDPSQTESDEESMADLSDIFGAIGDAIVGSIDFDPSTPGIFGGGAGTSLPDIIGDVFTSSPTGGTTTSLPTIPSSPAANGARMPGVTSRDQAIAARTGCSAAQVAQVRALSRGRRRRKRMLTKSDIADISTMAALLGKSSEAFRTWLARATH